MIGIQAKMLGPYTVRMVPSLEIGHSSHKTRITGASRRQQQLTDLLSSYYSVVAFFGG